MAEKTTYPEYSKNYPLLVKNLMKRPLSLCPDDIAMVYRNDAGEYFRFTWRQWHHRTCQLAQALKTLGVQEMALVKLTQGANKVEGDVLDFLQAEGVDKGKITKWMLPV